MVSKNELRVGFKFEADTSQLEMSKQKLGELVSGLQQIQNQAKNSSFTGKMGEDFKKAAEEAKNLEQILNKSWNSKLGQLDLTKFKQQLIESNKTMVQMRANLAGAGSMGTDSFNKVASSILNTNTQLKQTSTLLEKMSLTMANTIRFGISSSIFNNFTGSIQKAYDYVKKLDKSLNDIRIVSNASAADMERFAKYANTAAQNLGATTLDYTKAALIYYQQGLDEEQVKLRSDITVKMSNVLGESAEQVSDYMTAIWNNFAEGSENLEYYADVLAKLGAETASSAEEISQGLEKFSSVADTVGLSYEYAAAALTTVTDRTRQSADVVGTAFKTLFARIQDLELGDEGSVTIGKYSEALEKFDIHVLDSQGNLKKMDDILNEMGTKWHTMSEAQKVALAQNVAGVRQYTQLMSLMENWDFFQQNVDSARNATGALQNQQEIYLDSVEAHLEQLSAEAEKMYSSLLDEDAIKSFSDLLIGALKTINTYLTGLGGGLNGLATLGANAATLFSKQIAGAVNRGLENRELEKKKQNEGAFKQELAENIQSGYQRAGVSASEERVKAEADIALEISKIEKDITEEKYNQLTAYQKQIGENTEIITQLKNWKKDLEDIGISEKDDVAAIKAKKKTLEENNDLYNRQLNVIRKINNMLGESELSNKKITKAQKEELESALKALPNYSIKAKQVAQEINGKGKLRKLEDGLIDLQTELNDKVEVNEKNIGKINTGLERRKRLHSGEVEQLEEINQEGKNFVDETVKSTQKINEMQDVITAASLTMSTLTSTVGVFKTMFDPDLSGWEKIQSIFSVVVTQSLFLAKNWDSIKAAGPAIAKWAAARVAAMKAEEAQRLKNIALGEVENTQEATQVALEQAETAEDAAQAGFSLKETLINIVKIVQEGIITALKAVQKLLTGDITALGVAMVAALAAGVVALGAWIVHLIKVNSEEAKLQKQVEKTAEDVEKAKEKYKELADIISNYKNARSGIDELTEGTIEFYEAIIKSNEEAQKLIDTLGLMVGQDYTIDANGLINIDENALKKALYSQMQQVYITQSHNSQARANLENYNRKQIVSQFQADVNTEAQKSGINAYISRDQAEMILKNSTQANTELGNLTSFYQQFSTNYSKFQQNQENNLKSFEKTTQEGSKNVCSAVDNNAVKISDSITKYLPQYQASTKKIDAYETQAALNNLRGYLDQNEIEKFNNMSVGAQEAAAKILSNKKTQYKPVEQVSELQTDEKMKTWEWLVPLIGWGHGWGRTAAAKSNNRKLKELYMQNSLGYTKEGDVWKDASGNPLSQSKFKKIRDEIDTDTARNAYNSGEYVTETTYENDIKPTIDKAAKLSSERGFNSSSKQYIEEALLRLQSGTADTEFFNKLTNEEKEALRSSMGTRTYLYGDGTQKETNTIQGVDIDSQYSTEQVNSWLAANEEVSRSAERIKADLKDYNSVLGEQAAQLGTTKEALEFYAIATEKAGKMENQKDRASAESIALQYKFNKAYNKTVSVYLNNKKAIEAYQKALENHEEVAYDVADAMGELANSLKDMGLSLDAETISNHLDDVQKLLGGTEKEAKEAYVTLKELSNIDLLSSTLGVAKTEVESLGKTIAGLSAGDTLTGEFADNLTQMVNDAHLTEQELIDLFNNLHLEIPPYEAAPNEVSVDSVTVPGYATRHYYNGQMVIPDGKGGYKKETVDYYWDEWTQDHQASYVKINDNVKTYTSKGGNKGGNFKLDQGNKNKTSGGGGGGSSKKSEKESKDEFDRYHVVNTQIEKTNNILKKLENQEKKSLGTELLENLAKQWGNLNNQIDNYKEKLKIAQGEYRELQDILAKKGVKFKADGTVENYFEALKKQEDEYNKIVKWYNNLSAKKQTEAAKAKVDAAKEAYDKFKEQIDRIDTLASNEIPNIVQSMHDTIDQEIETNIKAFSLEVDLSLDLKEAQQQWNEFRHKVQNGLRDEDILGNAKLSQNNLNTLLSKGENGQFSGDLVNQVEHVQEILGQIDKQKQGLALKEALEQTLADENISQEDKEKARKEYEEKVKEFANVYGDNTKAALDDLEKYFKEATNSYTEAIEYQKELHQLYLDMLDQAKEKLDAQKEDYEQITNLLEHDKKLVELTYGEKAYAILDKYYKLQKQNNKEELQVLANQEKYYKARLEDAQAEMNAAKAALDAENLTADEYEQRNSKYLETVEKFEKTKEHWTEAVEASNSMLETSIGKAQESLENTLNLINQALAQGLTGKTGGLEYAEEEWDLINRNADQYLDTINRLQGENDLESKYIESINKAVNPSIQKKLKNAMDAEMKALKEKDKLTQYDLDRANKKYQITLAQIALEEAQQNKNKMRLRRDSQGNYRYQYVADDDQIAKAKQELSTLYTDLYNFDKEKYKSNLSEMEALTKEYQEKIAELSKINDPEERKERELLLEQQYAPLFVAIQEETETSRKNLMDSAFDDLSLLYDESKDKYLSMTEEETNALMTELVPAWDSVYAAIAQNMEPLNFVNESLNRQKEAWAATQVEIDEYLDILGKSKAQIAQAVDDIGNSIDEDIQKVDEFIDSNKELISAYETNLSSLETMIDDTDELIDSYKEEVEQIGVLKKAYEELETQMKANLKAYNDYAKKPSLVTETDKGDVNEEPAGEEPKKEEEPKEEKQPTSSSPKITDKLPDSTKLTKNQKKELQKFLNSMGYGAGAVDGIIGKKTKTALKKFQSKIGTTPDGSWGPKTWNAAQAAGYDTGGYTGTWGNSGRLAFLHQKELVLNAQDTENILNTVAIMRNLMASMNENILSRLAGVSAGIVTNLGGGNTGLEQNVHIDANFPNATNSNEIEEALRNLVNVASQRITK